MTHFDAMRLANIWSKSPSAAAHFGITGQLVREAFVATAPAPRAVRGPLTDGLVREMRPTMPTREAAPSAPWAYRRYMQALAAQFGVGIPCPLGIKTRFSGVIAFKETI